MGHEDPKIFVHYVACKYGKYFMVFRCDHNGLTELAFPKFVIGLYLRLTIDFRCNFGRI